MLHHISIPACRPLEVAKILVELLGGKFTEFGPNKDSYIAWTGDEFGTAIEVFPLGTEMLPVIADGQAQFRHNNEASKYTATHAAVSVSRSKEYVLELAHREGWRALELSRGSFRVIEFWIENQFMIEVLTDEMKQEYLDATARFQRRVQKQSMDG